MAVRRQCNRYRTEPFGRDYEDVLKRGKAFYKEGSFMMAEYSGVWSALNIPAFGTLPESARIFSKIDGRWQEVKR